MDTDRYRGFIYHRAKKRVVGKTKYYESDQTAFAMAKKQAKRKKLKDEDIELLVHGQRPLF